jgi:hypothetical protein
MLTRLIYASEAAENLDPGKVQALLEHARRSNRLRDITGMLIFDRRYFLQVLEGDRQLLSDLYGRFVTDSRHRRLLILGVEPIAQRLFSEWSMGFAAADESRRGLYLRHGISGQFEPHGLSAGGALAVLQDFARATTPDHA